MVYGTRTGALLALIFVLVVDSGAATAQTDTGTA
jgi:hypothetical protein